MMACDNERTEHYYNLIHLNHAVEYRRLLDGFKKATIQGWLSLACNNPTRFLGTTSTHCLTFK